MPIALEAHLPSAFAHFLLRRSAGRVELLVRGGAELPPQQASTSPNHPGRIAEVLAGLFGREGLAMSLLLLPPPPGIKACAGSVSNGAVGTNTGAVAMPLAMPLWAALLLVSKLANAAALSCGSFRSLAVPDAVRGPLELLCC